MKAKDLIKILEQHPEHTVGFWSYIGCDTILGAIDPRDVQPYKKGLSLKGDTGGLIGYKGKEKGKAITDIICLGR